MSVIGRHLMRSTASNIAGQAVVLGVWFALTPFIVHRLGAADYGLWALVASLVAYGQLLDLGVGGAVTKYVAEERARGDSDKASDLIATSLAIYCVVGLVVAVVTVPLSVAAPEVFNIHAAQETKAHWVILLTGGALAVQLPATTAYAVLRALQRFDLNNLIGAGATLLQALASVVVLLLGGGVVGLSAVTLPLTIVAQVPMLVVIRRIAPDLRLDLRRVRRSVVKRVVSFSTALFVINGSAVVKGKTDEIVIASALPISAVSPYSIARRVSDAPALVAYQFVRVVFPLASQLHGQGARERIRALFVASTRLTFALFMPIAVGLMVLAEPFLHAWVGPRFAADSKIVLILVGAGIIDIALHAPGAVMQATDAHRLLAVFTGACALLNLALSIALVGPLGVTGVALGTLIAAAVEAVLVTPLGMWRYGVAAKVLVRDALIPGLAPAIPAAAVLLLLRELVEPSSLIAVFVVGALGAIVYMAGYLSFAASVTERTALWRLAGNLRQLVRARQAGSAS